MERKNWHPSLIYFRLKSSPRISGTNKLDASFEPINSDGSTVLKNEHETASLPRGRLAVLEQNLLGKGSNKYVSSFKNHINPLYFGRVMYSINIIPWRFLRLMFVFVCYMRFDNCWFFYCYIIKPSIQQNKSVGSPNTVTKGKVSRAPWTSSVMALDSFPSTHPP